MKVKRPDDLERGTKEEKQERAFIQEEWDEQDNLARAILLVSLCDDQASLVCHLTSAKEMWERLLQAHQHRSHASRNVLMMQFYSASMHEKEPVIEYVSRVQRIFSQMRDSSSSLSEEYLVGRIICGLTPRYHIFMTNWGNNPDWDQTITELLPRLTAEESLIRNLKRPSSTEPLAMLGEAPTRLPQGRQQSALGSNKGGKYGKADKIERKKKLKCYKCGGKGHFKSECTKASKTDKVMIAEVLATEVIEEDSTVSRDSWVLDCAASDSMSND